MKKILVGILITGLAFSASAQDIHFSQYYASPLTLNPALIGGFNGTFRLAVNYRNQWFSVLNSSSYTTYSGSFDMPILKKKLKQDQFGVGLMVYNDKSGDGGLTNLTVMAGASYHKALDNFKRFKLAVGVTAGITQKRVNFNQLTFEEQYIADVGFDETAFNGEFSDNSIIYPDFVIGLLFQGRFLDNVNAYAGGSIAHVHKPKESFLAFSGGDNRLNPRFSAHVGIDFGIGDHVTLTPGLLYMSQGTAQELTAGLALGYKINDINKIFLGAWFRAMDKDALIPMIAYQIDGFRVGFSYDVNLSDLQVASNGNGAVEVSLIYIYNEEPYEKMSPVNFCPRF